MESRYPHGVRKLDLQFTCKKVKMKYEFYGDKDYDSLLTKVTKKSQKQSVSLRMENTR